MIKVHYIRKIKSEFSKRTYLLLCITFFLCTFIQLAVAEQLHSNLYVYKFGILSTWIKIYVRENLGIIHILQGIFANEYAGAACYPQYILLNGMIVYIIYLGVMVWRKKKK